MPTLTDSFSKWISERVSRHGAIGEMAKHAGVSRSAIEDWRDGIRTPTLETLDRVAAALGVPAWELIWPGTDPVSSVTSRQDVRRLLTALAAVDEPQLSDLVRLLTLAAEAAARQGHPGQQGGKPR